MAKEVLYRVIYGASDISANPEAREAAAKLTIQPAILHNFSRRRIIRADYPGITPQDGHTVRGTYVAGLNGYDMRRLDWFEGDEYSRKVVKVMVLHGDTETEEVEAETYVFTAGKNRLEDVEWDFEDFRREKMHRWADRSEEYKEVDEMAVAHDPTGGRGINSGYAFPSDDESMDRDARKEEMLESAV